MIKIILNNLHCARKRERELFKQAAKLLGLAMNTEHFKVLILAAQFTENKGLTNQAIYEKIMSGKDKYESGPNDQEIDLSIKVYKSFRKTVAYTKGSTYWIWFNRKFLGRYRAPERVANTLLHEYCHNLGFGHRLRNLRKTSVPYQAGKIAERTITNLGLNREDRDEGSVRV